MIALGRLGQSAEVEQIASRLLKQAGDDRRVLFQTACGLALASAGDGPVAERCRKRAIEVLASLVKAGWKDGVALKTDPDLDSIRGDQRFGELLAKVRRPS